VPRAHLSCATRRSRKARGYASCPSLTRPADVIAGSGRPNGTLAKLRAASNASRDAARQLQRQTLVRREQTATDVTPSQTLVQELQLRASGSPVCQLQLIVRRRCIAARKMPLRGTEQKGARRCSDTSASTTPPGVNCTSDACGKIGTFHYGTRT